MLETTFLPDLTFPATGRLLVYDPSGAPPDLTAMGLPHGEAGNAAIAVPRGDGIVVTDLQVRRVPIEAALPVLTGPSAPGCGASLGVWQAATRLATALLEREQVAPRLSLGDNGAVRACWRVLITPGSDAEEVFAALVAAMPPAAHAAAVDAESVWDPRSLLGAFLDAVADAAVRAATAPPRDGRPRERLLPWTARWAEALTDRGDPDVPLGADAQDLVAAVEAWLPQPESAEVDAITELRLEAPDPSSMAASWRLRFGVRTMTGRWVPAADVWGQAESSARGFHDVLLWGLGACAEEFDPMNRALATPRPQELAMSTDETAAFLDDVVDALRDAEVVVSLPPGLLHERLSVRLRVDSGAGADDPLAAAPASYRWEVAVGDDPLADDELGSLLATDRSLVRWRGHWLHLDQGHERVRSALRALPVTQGSGGELGLGMALRLALEGDESSQWLQAFDETGWVQALDEQIGPQAVEVVSGPGIAEFLERLRGAADGPPAPVTPPGFVGELRGYQRRGVGWLEGMREVGFGAVLADAMGLGKTVQLIAYLLTREERDRGPWLVVCPTSVVGNWEREVHRFAPELAVTRHHGPERAERLDDVGGVVLTTYGTLRRDADLLASVDWDVVAFDEAQHLKNPRTAVARAARGLTSAHRVALTGTPLENRLAELWALLDLTNPGLLGSRAAFGRRFVAPIERHGDEAVAQRLRRLVAPFVMRREKSDPAVNVDLPPKIERTVTCPLTPEQARLYRATLDRVLGPRGRPLEAASAMQRRGRILALLTALKQICNHPAQHRGEDGARRSADQLVGRSGKLAVAREIVAEAAAAGERTLVFTQYVEMGHLLVRQFSEDLGSARQGGQASDRGPVHHKTLPPARSAVPPSRVGFLHGGLSARARDRLVDAFQAGDGEMPVLVVSLRAGGSGLNLTAATQVLHYDRWWNPAVEDQATDRAHRIGQAHTVEVHKLVTAGTVEERIAAMLERKRGLASAVVGGGESWITELDDQALVDLVALSADATVEELDEVDLDWKPSRWEDLSEVEAVS